MIEHQSSKQTQRVIGLFPGLLGPGGVQLAGKMIVAALREIADQKNWALEILSLNDARGARELHLDADSVPFRGFGRAKAKFVYAALAAARKGAKNDSRIVLAAHPNLALPTAWIQRFVPGLRTIVVAHGIEVWQPMAPCRQRALQRASLVVAPSSYTVQKLTEIQRLAQERVRRFPWPLDPAFLKLAEAPENLPVPRGFPQGRVVLTVSRWAASERYKGADELIQGVARLKAAFPDLHLVLVGNGDDVPRLRQLAAESGTKDRIHFLEGLSREEVAACYSKADVFALPSTGEGFGFVFLEAMAFAKPVVGAAAGGITDLIEDGANGVLVPGCDTAKLTEVLDRLLRHDSLRRGMGHRGAETVRTKYAFKRFRNSLQEIIEVVREGA